MLNFNATINSAAGSQLWRVGVVGVLTIALQIPIAMIGRLVGERKQRRDTAVADVRSKWGDMQSVTGPALVLPYVLVGSNSVAGASPAGAETRYATFLPQRLGVTRTLDTESRSRGILNVPVYTLNVVFEGEFAPMNIADLGIDSSAVSWERAYLAVGISDVRAIREDSTLTWNDSKFRFDPGTGRLLDGIPGIRAPIALDPNAHTSRFRFSFPLALNGSLAFSLAPFAEETVVLLKSNSESPNFQGNWLPVERNVSADGFEALWRISYLGRNYPQSWQSGTDVLRAVEASRFGVELTDPIDHYQMAERSVKYSPLFILLMFASIWLTEVLANVRVHPVQYLLVGTALCIFYLLELSISEHLLFPVAYAMACLSILLMIYAYGRVILVRPRRSAVVATGVATLYGYLFILLTREDSALLIGSLGLFAVLAAIMYFTRQVDWFADSRGTTTE